MSDYRRPSAWLVAAAEAMLSILGNPGRAFVVSLGAVLGAGLFTATLGLTGTARSEVRADFDAFRATEVVASSESSDPAWVSPEDLARIRRLGGVVSAGLVRTTDERVELSTVLDRRSGVRLRVSGVTPGALDVIEPRVVEGRTYDQIHENLAVPVALVPEAAYRELTGVRLGSQILLDGEPFVVIGVYDGVARGLGVLGTVLVPMSASERWLADVPAEVLVEVAPGAAETIAAQLPVGLRPDAPGLVSASALLDPDAFRLRIEENVVRMSVAASIAALTVGALIIGIATGSSIATRVAEFGLRRALGATPGDLGLQVLAETALLGTFGGAVGASIGLIVTVGVALASGWTPALDVTAAAASVGFSALGGLIGGVVPARRAMGIEPAEALRR